jgi:preprotein translocase subunit SecG
MSILLGIATFLLILVALFLVLVVLMQKAKSDGGVGAALGGGMAEAAFGADTGNVLSKSTIYAAITFFVLTFGLYLGRIYEREHGGKAPGSLLPKIEETAAPAAASPAPSAAPVTAPATQVNAPGTTTTPPVEAPKNP